MKFLSKRQIVQINKSTVNEHGGNFMPPTNFLHEENLDYLLEAVQAEMFGQPLYPTVPDKAAIYCYNIICNHIFSDGNKRTGLGAATLFLYLNGYDISEDVTNKIMTDFILEIASGKVTLEECCEWFRINSVQL